MDVTNGSNSGAGTLREALDNLPFDATPQVVLIKSNVTNIYLHANIIAVAFGPLTIKTEGQTCSIWGASVDVQTAYGHTASMEKLTFQETTKILDCSNVIAKNCVFQGSSSAVGGLGVFTYQDSTDFWPNPTAQLSVTLNSCSASSTGEDGVQIKGSNPGGVKVSVNFCNFNSNSDDGFEAEDAWVTSQGVVTESSVGSITGSVYFSNANFNHNGFNFNEFDEGHLDMIIVVCDASYSSDSGIELKESGGGLNWSSVTNFDAEYSYGEGVLVREKDPGGVNPSLAFIDSDYSFSDHGVQVKESGSPSGTNQVTFLDINCFANYKHGFEIQVSGTDLVVNSSTGNRGQGSLFSNNYKSGFKVSNEDGECGMHLYSMNSTNNVIHDVHVETDNGNSEIEAIIDQCYIGSTRLEHKTWTSGLTNGCILNGVASAYGSLSLVPIPDPIYPGAEVYTNWTLSDLAIEVGNY